MSARKPIPFTLLAHTTSSKIVRRKPSLRLVVLIIVIRIDQKREIALNEELRIAREANRLLTRQLMHERHERAEERNAALLQTEMLQARIRELVKQSAPRPVFDRGEMLQLNRYPTHMVSHELSHSFGVEHQAMDSSLRYPHVSSSQRLSKPASPYASALFTGLVHENPKGGLNSSGDRLRDAWRSYDDASDALFAELFAYGKCKWRRFRLVHLPRAKTRVVDFADRVIDKVINGGYAVYDFVAPFFRAVRDLLAVLLRGVLYLIGVFFLFCALASCIFFSLKAFEGPEPHVQDEFRFEPAAGVLPPADLNQWFPVLTPTPADEDLLWLEPSATPTITTTPALDALASAVSEVRSANLADIPISDLPWNISEPMYGSLDARYLVWTDSDGVRRRITWKHNGSVVLVGNPVGNACDWTASWREGSFAGVWLQDIYDPNRDGYPEGLYLSWTCTATGRDK